MEIQILYYCMKAIKRAVPINQRNVEKTVNNIFVDILPALGLGPWDATVLGSTNKMMLDQSSGDIDIALNRKGIPGTDPFGFVKTVVSVYPEVKEMRGLGIVSIAYPIHSADGLQDADYCQVDLMLVDDLQMASFFYWAPNSFSSLYKGAHRTILLSTIAANVHTKPIKYWSNHPVVWSRLYLDAHGLHDGIQSNEGKQGRPCVTRKTLKKTLRTNDPTEILHTIIGPQAMIRDVESFERLYDVVQTSRFMFPNLRMKILSETKAHIKEAGLKMPKVLEAYR